MAENDEAFSERRARCGNTAHHLFVRESEILLRKRLPL